MHYSYLLVVKVDDSFNNIRGHFGIFVKCFYTYCVIRGFFNFYILAVFVINELFYNIYNPRISYNVRQD